MVVRLDDELKVDLPVNEPSPTFLRFYRTMSEFGDREGEIFREDGLPMRGNEDLLVLCRTLRAGPAQMSELRQLLMCSAVDLSRIIDHLDSFGLVRRVRDEGNDRRLVMVEATSQAEALIDRARNRSALRPSDMSDLLQRLVCRGGRRSEAAKDLTTATSPFLGLWEELTTFGIEISRLMTSEVGKNVPIIVLIDLVTHGPMSITSLNQSLQLTAPRLRRILDHLDSAHIVTRSSNEVGDRREVVVAATELGRGVLGSIEAAMGFTAQQMTEAVDLVERMLVA